MTNLRIVPAANHRKEPKAERSAWAWWLPQSFSPRYAPRNGHAIRPIRPNGPMVMPRIGRMMTAMTSPIVLPVIQDLVPQYFLTPRIGMT